MARDKTIKFLRTTKANLETQKTGSNLLIGEPYLITDEGRIAIGTANNAYSEMAKKSEIGGSSSTVVCGETLASGDIVQQAIISGNERVMKIRPTNQIMLSKDKQITNLASYLSGAFEDYFEITPNTTLVSGYTNGVRLLNLDLSNLTGNSITLSTSLSVSGTFVKLVKLSANKFVALSYSGSSIYAKAFTVSGNSITAGSNIAVYENYQCGYEEMTIVGLDNDSFLVMFFTGESVGSGYFGAKTYTVSGTTISNWNSNLYFGYVTYPRSLTLLPNSQYAGTLSYQYYSGAWYCYVGYYRVSSAGAISGSLGAFSSSEPFPIIQLASSNSGVVNINDGYYVYDRYQASGYLTLNRILYSLSGGAGTPLNDDYKLKLQITGVQSERMPATLKYLGNDLLLNLYRDSSYIYFGVHDLRLRLTNLLFSSAGQSLTFSGYYTPSLILFGNRYIAMYYYDSSSQNNYYCLFDLGNELNLFGIMQEAGTSGQTKNIALKGQVSTVHSNLIAGAKYYLSGGNQLTTIPSRNFAGTALSSTTLLVGL